MMRDTVNIFSYNSSGIKALQRGGGRRLTYAVGIYAESGPSTRGSSLRGCALRFGIGAFIATSLTSPDGSILPSQWFMTTFHASFERMTSPGRACLSAQVTCTSLLRCDGGIFLSFFHGFFANMRFLSLREAKLTAIRRGKIPIVYARRQHEMQSAVRSRERSSGSLLKKIPCLH